MLWKYYYKDLNIPKNWICESWGNDELPSFSINGFHIWVDSYDKNVRLENSKRIWNINKLAPRFIIQDQELCEVLLSTNNFNKVIKFTSKPIIRGD